MLWSWLEAGLGIGFGLSCWGMVGCVRELSWEGWAVSRVWRADGGSPALTMVMRWLSWSWFSSHRDWFRSKLDWDLVRSFSRALASAVLSFSLALASAVLSVSLALASASMPARMLDMPVVSDWTSTSWRWTVSWSSLTSSCTAFLVFLIWLKLDSQSVALVIVADAWSSLLWALWRMIEWRWESPLSLASAFSRASSLEVRAFSWSSKRRMALSWASVLLPMVADVVTDLLGEATVIVLKGLDQEFGFGVGGDLAGTW